MNWGAKITAVLIVFVVGIGTMVFICMRQTDIQLVTKDYYEQEIEYQKIIDKEKNYSGLIHKPEISIESTNARVKVDFSKLPDQKSVQGTISFFRPSQSKLDFAVAIILDQQGIQRIDQTKLSPGKWVIKLDWEDGFLEYYHEQTIWI
jgi:hypothetical protein